jgi:hypothetical protein
MANAKNSPPLTQPFVHPSVHSSEMNPKRVNFPVVPMNAAGIVAAMLAGKWAKRHGRPSGF